MLPIPIPDQIAVLGDFGYTMEGRHAGLAVLATTLHAGRKLHLSLRHLDGRVLQTVVIADHEISGVNSSS